MSRLANEVLPESKPRSTRWYLWGLGLLFFGGFLLHRGWFSSGIITYGDWGYLSLDELTEFVKAPHVWDTSQGLGSYNEAIHATPYRLLLGWLAKLGVSWSFSERLIFFFPFAFLPFISMFLLLRRSVRSPAAAALGALLYGANTYILQAGNNQLTIALAYGVAPLALAWLMDAVDAAKASDLRRATFKAACSGGWIALASVFDPRIALLVAALSFAYLVLSGVATRIRFSAFLALGGALIGSSALLQAYWLLPSFAGGTVSAVTEKLPESPWISWVSARHALTLYHPFWTGGEPTIFVEQPLNPIFLGLPAIGLAGVLLLKRNRMLVVYGACLVLVGSFLAKGENPPWGSSYTWAFTHVPGMRFFRDTAKFYLLIALGYGVLVAGVADWAVARSCATREKRIGRLAAAVMLGIVSAIVFMPVPPAFTQELGGTLRPVRQVPPGHRSIHRILANDPMFGRVFWIPSPARFAYKTRIHPAVDLEDARKIQPDLIDEPRARYWPGSSNDALGPILDPGFVDLLRAASIRYVVAVGEDDLASWPGQTAEAKRLLRRDTLAHLKSLQGLRPLVDRVGGPTLFRVEGSIRSRIAMGTPASVSGTGSRMTSLAPLSTVFHDETPASHQWLVPDPRTVSLRNGAVHLPFEIALPGWLRLRSGSPNHVRATIRDTADDIIWRGSLASLRRGLHMNPGSYRLVIRDPAIQTDVLPNGSFEDGPWVPVGDALAFDQRSPSELQLTSTTISAGPDRGRALHLSAGAHVVGVSQTLPTFERKGWYRLAVRWRRLIGPPPEFAYWWGERVRSRRIHLRGSDGWNDERALIQVPEAATEFGLTLFSGPGGTSYDVGAALFDHVRIDALPGWLVDLSLSIDDGSSARTSSVNAEWTPAGTYRFSVDVRGPVMIHLNEHDARWTGTFTVENRGTRRPVSASKSQSPLGTVAWIVHVPQTGSYRLHGQLVPSGQTLAYLGLGVSGLALSMLLIAAIRARGKRLERDT